MATPSSFLQLSDQALAKGTKCLRFALLEDLQRDRKAAGARQRHQIRYRGTLLAVRSGYDPSDPLSIKDTMSAETALGAISMWARAGFHPDVFEYLVAEIQGLQGRIDAITADIASDDGKQNSPTDTLETFLALAYHTGVVAIAESSGTERDGFTAATAERIVRRSLVRSPAFDLIQIGAPQAAVILAGAIVDVLDYMYIAMHGDMAFILGCWVNAFEMQSFTTEKPEIEVFHPVDEPAFSIAPPFPGLPAFPTPPQFPQPSVRPTLTLQSTVYRRWEELARGPRAVQAIAREKERIGIGKWLDDKPSASPPAWPLPVFGPPPKDKTEWKRQTVGFNANLTVGPRLDWLKQLLAGTDKPLRGTKAVVLSHITYPVVSGTDERLIFLTGGAYPRGGRKPPSITHDTTYGLDLDLEVPDVDQRTLTDAVRELKEVKETLSGFEDPELGASYATFFAPGRSPLGTEHFRPAVALTQALLTTLPSRVIFGDLFVLVAAFGGLMDHLKATGATVATLPPLFSDQEKYLILDPKVHFNHWHVDWVPRFEITRVPDWAFAPKGKASWDVKGDSGAFSNRERDYWRPVPIRYAAPRVCGTPEQVVDLNIQLGTGIDLTSPTSIPPVSPFPIGNIEDLPTLLSWVDQYFPQWRPPS